MPGASIIHWYGGKYFMLKRILPLIPGHDVYVEVFGGAAHLLFAKPPAKVNVYNDIDNNLVNFFRVLRDPEKAKRLQQLLYLTPYSRKEFEFCRDYLNEPGIDDVERARRFFVVVKQSFNGYFKNWKYNPTPRRAIMYVETFYNSVDKIPEFTEFLRKVQIENDDFERVIKRYDSPETFFYCDPPYVTDTIKTEHPYQSMSLQDHRRLVNVLLNVRGKVMLSGYDHPVYAPLEKAGWRKIQVRRPLYATNPRKNLGGRRIHQIEYLWLNYDPPRFISQKPDASQGGQAKITDYA